MLESRLFQGRMGLIVTQTLSLLVPYFQSVSLIPRFCPVLKQASS